MNRALRSLVLVTIAMVMQAAVKAQPAVAVRTLGDREHVTVMELDGVYDRLPGSPEDEQAIRKAVAREYLRTHTDDYDFLVTFTQFPFSLGVDTLGAGVGGRYYGIKNDVQGIGLPAFDHTGDWGSTGQLQGYIDMGTIGRLASQPSDPRFEQTLSTLAHEMGHRWLSHARFRDTDGSNSSALLGREGVHWSFLLNSANSVLYGNDWRDNGDGTVTATGRARTVYSPLDLYLMGLRGASQVPPFTLIENPTEHPERLPEVGATITGTAKTITIDDVIAAEGPRVPSVDDSPKRFKVGFVLLVRPGRDAEGSELAGINAIRDAFATRTVILTEGKAIVEVFADTPTEVLVPPPPVLPPSSGPRATPADLPQAVAWTLGRQQANGSWADSSWTGARDTAAVLDLLRTIPGALTPRDRALAWLTGLGTSPNVDTASRRIGAIGAPPDVNFLSAAANPTGGWGLGRGYESDPLDTALALQMFVPADATKHIGFLVQSQNADGGWGMHAGGPGSIDTTTEILALGSRYPTPALVAALNRASTWLAVRQHPDGGFGDGASTPDETARAILRMVGTNFPRSQLALSLNYLKLTQLADGSWNESVHDTALAIRALQTAEQPNAAVDPAAVNITPSNPVEGQPVTIDAEIANLGSEPLLNLVVRFFDGDPSLGRQIASDALIGTLAGLARTRVTVQWDTHGRTGDHALYVVLDPANQIAESNEADNVATRNITVRAPDAGVDLAVTAADILLAPSGLVSLPQAQSLSATVSNLGLLNATGVTISVFDGDPAGSGIKVADRRVEIPGQGSAMVSLTFDVQSASDHHYFVVADPLHEIPESDRTNNSASALLSASVTLDLAVDPGGLSFSENPVGVGHDVTISAAVRNQGTTGAFDVPVRFSIDDATGPIALGTRSVNLQPGEARTMSIVWRTVRPMANASVVVDIDPANVFAETSEANNHALALLTVNASTLANLHVSAEELHVQTPLDEGGSATVSVTVHNQGTTPAGNVEVVFFAGNPDSGGVVIGSHVVPNIAASAQSLASIVWQPISSRGTVEIFAVVDRGHAIPEFAEDDNSAFVTMSVRSLPDLSMGAASIRFEPSFPRQGEPVTITATILNGGGQNAHGVVVSFFDGNPAVGGVAIGSSVPVGDIAAGGLATAHVALSSASAGVHEIFVHVDPANQVIEQRKDNNTASRRLGAQDSSLWFSNRYFSPNGDEAQDTTELFFRLADDRAVATIAVENVRREVVRTFELPVPPGPSGNALWDGRDADGRIVADGEYAFRLLAPGGAEIASAVVVLDNNASLLSEALGTEFFLNNNLTCSVAGPNPSQFHREYTTSDYQTAGWLADESGLVQWIWTQAHCQGQLSIDNCAPTFTEPKVGVYVLGPNGDAPRRITPDSWTVIPPLANGTEIGAVTLSPDGRRIAITVSHYAVTSGLKRHLSGVEHWVINSDGSGLSLAGTSTEFVIGTTFASRGQFSPDGEHLLFWQTTLVSGASVSRGVVVNLTDGTQTLIQSSLGYMDTLAWAPDGRHILGQIRYFEPAHGGYVSQLRSYRSDGSGSTLVLTSEYFDFRRLNWLGSDRIAVIGDFQSDGIFMDDSVVINPNNRLWLLSLTGEEPRELAQNVWSAIFVSSSPDHRQLIYANRAVDGGSSVWLLGTGDQSPVPVYATNPSLQQSLGDFKWSPDSRLVAFRGDVSTTGTEILFDLDDRWVRALTLPEDPIAWTSVDAIFPDRRTLLVSQYSQPYSLALDIETGTLSPLPLKTYAPNFSFSPSGKSLRYVPAAETTSSDPCWVGYSRYDQWMLTSMLNLSAQLSFSREGGGLVLRGTAQDLNFSEYRLDFATAASPASWSPIGQPSNAPVANGDLARWIPPSAGSFLVRLTVSDKAGNITAVVRPIAWGLVPAITNLAASPSMFSPNGDGSADSVTLNYIVLAPVALDFHVFDGGGHILRTIHQQNSTVGPASIAWDGRDDAGGFVAEGTYRIHVREFDIFVKADNTPPDVAVTVGSGLHVSTPANCVFVGGLIDCPP